MGMNPENGGAHPEPRSSSWVDRMRELYGGTPLYDLEPTGPDIRAVRYHPHPAFRIRLDVFRHGRWRPLLEGDRVNRKEQICCMITKPGRSDGWVPLETVKTS